MKLFSQTRDQRMEDCIDLEVQCLQKSLCLQDKHEVVRFLDFMTLHQIKLTDRRCYLKYSKLLLEELTDQWRYRPQCLDLLIESNIQGIEYLISDSLNQNQIDEEVVSRVAKFNQIFDIAIDIYTMIMEEDARLLLLFESEFKYYEAFTTLNLSRADRIEKIRHAKQLLIDNQIQSKHPLWKYEAAEIYLNKRVYISTQNKVFNQSR
ncbi:hypothetical protein FGO68_gene15486 [Halteria grandinella]|uniref:Uncharacterized protein n=1 Tax=Halteria grandinella TaxID=5974 RepID=A0A8J8NFT9_HALGN|nr:hypothetical protein FGO68_gene15486 [Halteria grandinella]